MLFRFLCILLASFALFGCNSQTKTCVEGNHTLPNSSGEYSNFSGFLKKEYALLS